MIYNYEMTWVVSGLIMFFSSVALYLFIRKSQFQKNSDIFNNLAMFLIPCIAFGILNIVEKNSMFFPLKITIVFIMSGILFSYLGNVVSLISIKLSPNPGYSLIISKSYVIYTAIISIFLFESPLPTKSIFAIILIVLFSALIMIQKISGAKKTQNNNWLLYAFGAFFAWGNLALASKYLINQGVPVTVTLFYLTLIVSLLAFLEAKFRKTSININKRTLPIFLLIGIFSALFNLFMQVGYIYAPNPGYINAVNASSISLLTLASAYFFKDELTLRKIIGVVGVTAGLILLVI